jgi:thioredoxin reductase
MKTKYDGIYACGDVIKKELYQIATAVSDGARAATCLKRELDK